MPLEHRNRRGDVYLLQVGQTRTGKPKYYFGRKLTGTPLERIPEGFEVFEAPDRAQVYLRKTRTTEIADVEREIVEESIRRLATIEHFIVNIEADCLVVYLPGTSSEDVDNLIGMLADPLAIGTNRMNKAREQIIQRSDYEKMLRFKLVDKDRRLYVACRWCFRGSIDDWIFLNGPAPLSDLAEQFAQHLGSESFFELI